MNEKKKMKNFLLRFWGRPRALLHQNTVAALRIFAVESIKKISSRSRVPKDNYFDVMGSIICHFQSNERKLSSDFFLVSFLVTVNT